MFIGKKGIVPSLYPSFCFIKCIKVREYLEKTVDENDLGKTGVYKWLTEICSCGPVIMKIIIKIMLMIMKLCTTAEARYSPLHADMK